MPEKLPQHKHCLTCGKAILPRDEYCSEACERERIDTLQRKKRQLLMLYAVSVIVVIVAFVLTTVR